MNNQKTIIYLGSDHGGFELKNKAKEWLANWGYEFKDLGADELVNDDDYPGYAFRVAAQVSSNENSIGILLCRSGGGMIIAANKVKGIRAVSAHDKKSAIHAKEHNNANIISISSDWTSENQEKEILSSFLSASFSGEERHVRRLNKIVEFEKL